MIYNEYVTFASNINLNMKYNELISELKTAKCSISRNGSNHDMWYSPITGKTFPVPRHGSHEVPKGTECKIRKAAGI